MAYAKDAPMPRLIARLLLLVVALGIFQPLLEAFSAEPPHACCLRRLHARSGQKSQFRDARQPNANCCPPLTTPHTANPASRAAASVSPYVAILKLSGQNDAYHAGSTASLSTRAPPSPDLS